MSVAASVAASILNSFLFPCTKSQKIARTDPFWPAPYFNDLETNPWLTTLSQFGKTGILHRLSSETGPRLGPFGISLLWPGLIAG